MATMELKYKQQWYQENAVNALVSCFEWQRILDYKWDMFNKTCINWQKTLIDVVHYRNQELNITNETLRENIRNIQKRNDIPYTEWEPLSEFSIEMETWTWKTFTYIKSMFELNKEYWWTKFIVMTPSIPIKEWIKKSFQTTEKYFQSLYWKKINYFIYDASKSDNVSNIATFAQWNGLQVMIITYQAFNSSKSKNIIDRELDALQSYAPITLISEVSPILIIDEPQKFSDNTESMFKKFNPLFTVRYSATHKKWKEYNKLYRLDAVDAYNQKLVKKINVKWVELVDDVSVGAYMYLDHIEISPNKEPYAVMEIEVKTSTWVSRKSVHLHKDQSLFDLSWWLTQYQWYKVSEIDARDPDFDLVEFTNNKSIKSWQIKWTNDTKFLNITQIEETIKSHLDKEKDLFSKWIKVLSLFFLDTVSNYKYYDESNNAMKWEFAKYFEDFYEKEVNRRIQEWWLSEEYIAYLRSATAEQVHAWYFAIDKKSWHEVDPSLSDKKEYLSNDEDSYELIMKDKERLLSLDPNQTRVRFIFSHSALREWWDNPNIFQICTLWHWTSGIKKRQEIWRWLRICINQDWERMDSSVCEWKDFHFYNTLSVIANESYEEFAATLQKEMNEQIQSRIRDYKHEYFLWKKLTNLEWERLKFDEDKCNDVYFFLRANKYIDTKNNNTVTEEFLEDLRNDKIEIPEEFKWFELEVSWLLKKLYLENQSLAKNEKKVQRKQMHPNKNFTSQEFQALRNKIKVKSFYQVNFVTDTLIKNSIEKINKDLDVIKVTEWEQKKTISAMSVRAWESMEVKKWWTNVSVINKWYVQFGTKYDLVWEITRDTWLKRKTIIDILTWISEEKFSLYACNPEEFIRWVSKYINSCKAEVIIQWISYYKLNESYDSDIFIQNVNFDNVNSIELKKHIYDHIFTDSNIEIEFAKKLEEFYDITVYAKLPDKFRIPTPVWNYNPDWAIVFNGDKYKWVYFIAETKWTSDQENRREVENAKIECARKHFKEISDNKVWYDAVKSIDELRDIVLKR